MAPRAILVTEAVAAPGESGEAGAFGAENRSDARRPRRFLSPDWRATLFLSVVAAFNYGDRTAFSAVLAPLRRDLGLTDVTLGMLGAVFLWTYAVCSPLAGIVADRFSRTRLVVFSLAAWSVVTALIGTVNGVGLLYALRIGFGVAQCFYLPAAIALLADYHASATRGRAISVHAIGQQFGVIAGSSLAGYMAQHYGWRTGFVFLGVAGMALALCARFFLVEPTAAEARAARTDAGALAAFRYLLRVPTYHVLLAKVMLAGYTTWTFLSWLPLYFRESFQMNLGAAGFAGTFMLQISVIAGVAVGGWVSDLAGAQDTRRRMLVFAGGYLAAAPMLLIFLTRPGFVAVAVAVSGFSFLRGLGDASEKPVLCDIIPPRFRSTSLGLMNTCATAAGGLGVFLAGYLKAGVGLEAVFAGISVLLLTAGLGLLAAYHFLMPRDLERARQFNAAHP